MKDRVLSNHRYYVENQKQLLDDQRTPKHYTDIRAWQLERILAAHRLLSDNHCADCGKRNYAGSLQFHHIEGDGAEHRAERHIGNATWQMAAWIIRFPELAKRRIESLCHKCHVKAERPIRRMKRGY